MEYSQITGNLFVGTPPQTADYDQLRQLGVTLVINMRVERGSCSDTHDPPMKTLLLRTFDTPIVPIPIRALRKGVQAALHEIHSGGKVYSHCQQGVHRSVAMAICILIAQGEPVEVAMRKVAERRAAADPYAPHIKRRILKFSEEWNAKLEDLPPVLRR